MIPGRIAAILTCYDFGRWLPESLESVERQTRPAASIVVVDDGSTDLYTRQVLSRLEEAGTRIAHSGGGGAAVARNHGARLVSSDYIVWLDADDVLEPDYFAAAAAVLDERPEIDFVSSAIRGFGDASYVWTPPAPTFVEAIGSGGWPHASTMIRRRLWDELGGFDESLRMFELLDFWASAMARGSRGVVLEKPLLNYRVRPGSGYQRMLQPDAYRAHMARFYAKHRNTVERHGADLVLAKEAFLLAQRDANRALEARAASLEAEIAQLDADLAAAGRALEERGRPRVDWGDLGRTEPVSRNWGIDRGRPIDRYYIEAFLARHQADIRGRVLEVKEPMYTRRFGGDAVVRGDVLDVDPANPQATITADLRHADQVPSNAFDCLILTQTLHVIDDMRAVLAECARMLRPDGVLLLTAPSVSRIDPASGVDGDFWRLTEASARTLFADLFPLDAFEVAAYGNVKACTAFLHGLAVEEMAVADLDRRDEAFPLVVTVRAVKPDPPVVSGVSRTDQNRTCTSYVASILCYHRVADLSPDSHSLCLPPDEFRAQMAHLRGHYTPIGLDDLVRAAASGTMPERAVAVTLDDGYVDALTTASAILLEYGVPATFFVNGDRLDERHERWWDGMERVFLGDAPLPEMLTIRAGGQELRVPVATRDARAAALDRVNRVAWALDADGRERLLDEVVRWSGIDFAPRSSHRVLTGEEIRELASHAGHAIGAHTTHHLALPTQPLEAKRREVLENKAALERLLGRSVSLFAYPYGELDAETRSVVRDAGFHAAVTVRAGLVSAGANRLLLPRHEIAGRDREGFPVRLRRLFEGSR